MTASIGWLLLFLVPKLHYVPWDGIMIFWRKIWSALSSIFFSLYLNSCFAHCWVLFGIEIKFHLKENTYTKAYTYIAHWIRSMVFSDIFIWYVWFHYTIQASIYVWLLGVSILKRLQELNQDTIRSSSWHPTNEESRSITRWFLALQQQHDRKWFCSTRRWAVLDQ